MIAVTCFLPPVGDCHSTTKPRIIEDEWFWVHHDICSILTPIVVCSPVITICQLCVCVMLLWLLIGKTVSDPNAVWAAYYAAQAQPYTYPAAVQPTLQSVTGQQAAPYAALSRATVTPQPSMLYASCCLMIVESLMFCCCASSFFSAVCIW